MPVFCSSQPHRPYARVPIAWTASPDDDFAPGMTGQPWVGNYRPVWTDAPMVRHFGVFSAEDGGHCLCWFAATPPFVEPPTNIPPFNVALLWDLPVLLAINGTALSGGTSEECQPVRGTLLGRLNCQPVYCGINAAIHAGALVTRVSLSKSRRPLAAAAAE
jgi:hypothetical protein